MYKRRKKNNKTSYLYLKCVVFSLFFAPRLFPVTDTVRAKEPGSFSCRPCIHWREGMEGGREECKSQQSRKSWRNQWRTEIERNPFPTWNPTCTSGWHLFSFFFFFDILSSSVTDDVSLGLSPPYCYRFVFYHRLLGPLVSVELWPVVVSAGQTHFGQN